MTRHQRIDDLTTFAVPGQPAVSPDGGQCLYVLRTTDAEADRDNHAIWLVSTTSRRRSSASPFAAPRTRIIIPSVTMNEMSRSFVMSSPFTAPPFSCSTVPG